MYAIRSYYEDMPRGVTSAATVLPAQIYVWSSESMRAFTERTSAGIIVLVITSYSVHYTKLYDARGIVIAAELDKGRGPVATILVQKGTLHVGDNIAIGSTYGKVRAMIDHKGKRVKDAVPSTPVEILGLNAVPGAGDIFVATENEKEARNIASAS